MQDAGAGPEPQTLRDLIDRGDLDGEEKVLRLLGDRFLVILPQDEEGRLLESDLTGTVLDDTMDLHATDSLARTTVYPLRLEGGADVFVSVGRVSDRDVQLSDGSVSSLHAVFRREQNGALTVQDMGSTNGTWIDEASVPAKGAGPASPVEIGSSIRFGNVRSVFLDSLALHRLLAGQS